MAASRCSRTPILLSKRIKLFHNPQSQPALSSSPSLHTTAAISRPLPTDNASDKSPSDTTLQPSLPPSSVIRADSAPLPLSTSPSTPVNDHPLRPQQAITQDLLTIARQRGIPIPPSLDAANSDAISRLPRSLQALYLNPLRREPTHNIVSANLQLRSYSVRNLELMADFAMRAAYYLNLPAKGPVPLPRITQRWTVPRSNFVHKKSQENWERVTVRRLVQILDGHPEVVRRWLGFIRKWNWYGVGMKADVFEYEGTDVVARMDKQAADAGTLDDSIKWELLGRRKGLQSKDDFAKVMDEKGFGVATKNDGASIVAKPSAAKAKKAKTVAG